MSFFIQIIVSGLTLGAMYAIAAVGLALVWGSFNMLNMSHGVIMTLGAYFALIWAQNPGLPLETSSAAIRGSSMRRPTR